jgi:hypothetical protein
MNEATSARTNSEQRELNGNITQIPPSGRFNENLKVTHPKTQQNKANLAFGHKAVKISANK